METVSAHAIARAQSWREFLLSGRSTGGASGEHVEYQIANWPQMLAGLYAMPEDLNYVPQDFKELIFIQVIAQSQFRLMEGFLDKMVHTPDEIDVAVSADVLLNAQARAIVLDYIHSRFGTLGAAQILEQNLLDLLNQALRAPDIQPHLEALTDIIKPCPLLPVSLLNQLNFYTVNGVFGFRETEHEFCEKILDVLLRSGFDQNAPIVAVLVEQSDTSDQPKPSEFFNYLHLALHNLETSTFKRSPALPTNTMVQHLLDRGANWRCLLDAPTVSAFQREVLLRQPQVRKALLEELATPSLNITSSSPRVKL